jgi:hypothetical protein
MRLPTDAECYDPGDFQTFVIWLRIIHRAFRASEQDYHFEEVRQFDCLDSGAVRAAPGDPKVLKTLKKSVESPG